MPSKKRKNKLWNKRHGKPPPFVPVDVEEWWCQHLKIQSCTLMDGAVCGVTCAVPVTLFSPAKGHIVVVPGKIHILSSVLMLWIV